MGISFWMKEVIKNEESLRKYLKGGGERISPKSNAFYCEVRGASAVYFVRGGWFREDVVLINYQMTIFVSWIQPRSFTLFPSELLGRDDAWVKY